MFLVWLPLYRIFGQGIFSIFQRQCVLKEIDQRLLPCQATFTVEEKISEASVTRLGKPSCLTNRGEGTIHVVWLKLSASHPAKYFRRRVPPIFPFFMRQVLLKVVIEDPLFMHRNQVFPALRRLEIPVSHPSLHIKRRFYQILPTLPLLYFKLFYAQRMINVHGPMISKNAAVVTHQCCWASMFANRRIQYRNIFFKVLPSGHCGSQDRPRIAL